MANSFFRQIRTAGLLAAALAGLGSCHSSGSSGNAPQAALSHDQLVARGHYLVSSIGCGDCHSPKTMTPMGPVQDSSRLLSGFPSSEPVPMFSDSLAARGIVQAGPDLTSWRGPWGTSFTANLTPDSATGIGAWSLKTFIQTLRTGHHLGLATGRPVLPPMPVESFRNMTDLDLQSIYAYLQTLPAIQNRVHAPLPPTGMDH